MARRGFNLKKWNTRATAHKDRSRMAVGTSEPKSVTNLAFTFGAAIVDYGFSREHLLAA
jgi:hypothetical protein